MLSSADRVKRLRWYTAKATEVSHRAAKGCDILTFQGSPYLSALSFPTLVSQAHTFGTEVIISPQGLVG